MVQGLSSNILWFWKGSVLNRQGWQGLLSGNLCAKTSEQMLSCFTQNALDRLPVRLEEDMAVSGGQHRTLLWFVAHSWFCQNILLAPNAMFVCHDRFPLPIQLSKVSLVLLTSASQGSTYFRPTPASLQMSCGCQSGPDYRNGWTPKPFPHKVFILANSWWKQFYEIYNK